MSTTSQGVDVCLCLDGVHSCGCGKSHAPDSRNYHYNGTHWAADCLVGHLHRSLSRMAMTSHRHRQEHIRLIKLVPCCTCGLPAGTGCVKMADAVFCRKCSNDIGGQG